MATIVSLAQWQGNLNVRLVANLKAKRGELPPQALQHADQLAQIELVNRNEATASYVLGTDNFYAITRYNWSSQYAMAVIDLAQAIEAAAQTQP